MNTATSTANAELTDSLGLELMRHARLLHMLKAHMVPVGHELLPSTLDAAAIGLLMAVLKLGPLRQGELAEHALLDPSTVSRHVAQLVKAGLVERQADAADGRAVRLCASADGRRLGEEISQRRRATMRQVTESWSPEDLTTLITLLRRLNDDVEAAGFRKP